MNESNPKPATTDAATKESGSLSGRNQVNIHDLSEITRRLSTTINRANSFLRAQFQRLGDSMQWYSQVRNEHDRVKILQHELDHEKRQWNQQRDLEIDRLEEASQNLAKAWQQLEHEQRQMQMHLQNPPQEPQRTVSAHSAVAWSPATTVEHVSAKAGADNETERLTEIQMLRSQIRSHSMRRK